METKKSYKDGKIGFLQHRVFIIEDRLKKSEGADIQALEFSLQHFKEILSDYKSSRL